MLTEPGSNFYGKRGGAKKERKQKSRGLPRGWGIKAGPAETSGVLLCGPAQIFKRQYAQGPSMWRSPCTPTHKEPETSAALEKALQLENVGGD